MEIILVDTCNKRQVRDFLELPGRLYRDCPQWVPGLLGDERVRLDRHRYPYYRHSQAAFFVAYEGSLPIGRLAVLDNRLYNEHNRDKAAFFHWFECVDDANVADGLFTEGTAWALGRGLETLIGPKGFTALDGLGMLVKGFEYRPALGLPYNPPYYPGLIEALGFVAVEDIVSGYLGTDLQFPERILQLAQRIKERRGLHIAELKNRRDLRRWIKILPDLYNSIAAGASGSTPLTLEEIQVMADQLLWFADPHLIKLVMKGEQAVGFMLAYPDISAAIQATKGRLFPFGWLRILMERHTTKWININGAGMLEEYRGLGGTAILYAEMFKSVAGSKRYRHAEVVQIGIENVRMQREMMNFGVDFYKAHRIYRKDLVSQVPK